MTHTVDDSMPRKVVLSQRVDAVQSTPEIRDAIDQDMTRWLRLAGFHIYPIANTMQSKADIFSWLHNLSPEYVVLSGGNDIGECPARDFTEAALIDYAETHKLPLLGICRGMQMLAWQSQVSLYPVSGHVNTRHQLVGEISGEANSFHEYAITECPENYEILARSQDGVIKAIRRKDMLWEGWMWHPERENPFSDRDFGRLRELFQ